VITSTRASWLAFLALASAWAAAVAGLAVLPLSAAAFAVAPSAGTPAAAMLVAWLGAAMGIAALSYAAASATVAHGLRRGSSWAHRGALALALVNLFVPPFGTAHGIYALWLLLAAPRPGEAASEVTHVHV
jgi:hypothetical protein